MGHWTTAEINRQINFLEEVVGRYESSVDSLYRFEKRLVERGIKSEFRAELGFSPTTVLQVARADIDYARGVILSYERFGEEHPVAYEHTMQILLPMLKVRRRVVETAMDLAEDFHNIMEDMYGQDAAHAWEESQDDQIVAKYASQTDFPSASAPN